MATGSPQREDPFCTTTPSPAAHIDDRRRRREHAELCCSALF
uniref:Uncharacterized protein n=1 Tax=Arundo donax TaxID=35708 RepID=A0A0A9A6Z7_ARUDO